MGPSAPAQEGEQPAVAHSTESQEGQPGLGELSKLQRLLLNLNECNWEQLEERHADAMNEHNIVEESLRAEMAELLEVSCRGTLLTAWAYLISCIRSSQSGHRSPRTATKPGH